LHHGTGANIVQQQLCYSCGIFSVEKAFFTVEKFVVSEKEFLCRKLCGIGSKNLEKKYFTVMVS